MLKTKGNRLLEEYSSEVTSLVNIVKREEMDEVGFKQCLDKILEIDRQFKIVSKAIQERYDIQEQKKQEYIQQKKEKDLKAKRLETLRTAKGYCHEILKACKEERERYEHNHENGIDMKVLLGVANRIKHSKSHMNPGLFRCQGDSFRPRNAVYPQEDIIKGGLYYHQHQLYPHATDMEEENMNKTDMRTDETPMNEILSISTLPVDIHDYQMNPSELDLDLGFDSEEEEEEEMEEENISQPIVQEEEEEEEDSESSDEVFDD